MSKSSRTNIDKMYILKSTEVFSMLDIDTLYKVSKIADERVLFQGEFLYKKGESADNFYILLEGDLEVFFDEASGNSKVIHAGDMIGEISLFDTKKRTETVKAMSASTLLEFQRDNLIQLLKNNGTAAYPILKLIARKFREALETIE